jgi:hypothetical protein
MSRMLNMSLVPDEKGWKRCFSVITTPHAVYPLRSYSRSPNDGA